MISKRVLPLLFFSGIATLSGCAESQTMGGKVGQGVNELVSSFAQGAQQAINESQLFGKQSTAMSTTDKQTVNKVIKSNHIPKDDMVHLFGWMEDGCLGNKAPYNKVYSKYTAFVNSFYEMKETKSVDGTYMSYVPTVTPRSQWVLDNKEAIKNIKFSRPSPNSGERYTAMFTITFNNNVTYRGQPLSEYRYQFVEESEGSEKTLKFASNANMSSVWPSFYTRQYSPYWAEAGEIVDSSATYYPKVKAVVCRTS